MSLYICKLCGKDFQNQDDLEHHKNFERQIRKEEEKDSIGEDEGVARYNISKRTQSANVTLNLELAARLASLLEGLQFPATKSRIKDHVQMMSQILKQMKTTNTDNDRILFNLLDEKLLEYSKILYNNTYEIEKALGLVMEKK